MTCRLIAVAVIAPLICLGLGGCRGGDSELAYATYTGGNPYHGRDAILRRDCGSCHTIPGVRGAHGMVGPPLVWFARRTFIGGRLPNSPENLARWLHNPPEVSPGTAMPNLGLGNQEVRDVEAYLYTLR